MLDYGCNAWNISAKMNGIFSEAIDNSSWRVYVAKLMLNWKDSTIKNDIKVVLPPVGPIADNNHDPTPMLYLLPRCVWCVLCCLEISIWKNLSWLLEINLDKCDNTSNCIQENNNMHLCNIMMYPFCSSIYHTNYLILGKFIIHNYNVHTHA